jgi:cysteine-rich repeat protein
MRIENDGRLRSCEVAWTAGVVALFGAVLVGSACGRVGFVPLPPTDGSMDVSLLDGSIDGPDDTGVDTAPACSAPVGAPPCGDGMLGSGEECDDCNGVAGDGCGTSCLLEGSCLEPVLLDVAGTTLPDGRLVWEGSAARVDHGTGSCTCGSPDLDRIVRYSPEATGRLQLSLRADSYDALMHVRRDCDDEASELACDDDGLGSSSVVQLDVTAGETMFVFADACAGSGPFTLEAIIERPDTPGSCALPIDLSTGVMEPDGTVTVSGSTSGAIDHGAGSCACAAGTNDQVVGWTAPAAGRFVVELQSTVARWDTLLHVREDCRDASTELECDDDGGGFEVDSRIERDVAAGSSLFFLVDACGGAGEYLLRHFFAPGPVSGTCAVPRDLATVGTVMGDGSITYDGATSRFDAGAGSCACGGSTSDDVLVWTPTVGGRATIEMASTGPVFDTLLHVRRDCTDELTELACNDDAPGTDSRLDVDVVGGEPVFIFADACSGRGGYQLRVIPP